MTQSNPSVAVLITYHNEGALLRECLDSLRANSRQPDEIIIYDDASTLQPEPFIPSDVQVRVLRGIENRGPSHGRNVLLNASRSTYIHFHDADDLFAPDWCDAVHSRCEKDNLDAVFTEIISFTHGHDAATGRIDLGDLSGEADFVRYCLSHALLPASGTYRRTSILKINGYSEAYSQSEDYDFHIRLAVSGVRFGVILQPLVRMRRHGGNRSNDQVSVFADAVRILESLAPNLDSRYRPDCCEALGRTGRTLFHLGAPAEARHAFAVAKSLGRPKFMAEPAIYRLIAHSLGPMLAERVGRIYRSFLPDNLRRRIGGMRRSPSASS